MSPGPGVTQKTIVIPAQAGIQNGLRSGITRRPWVPACAGTTGAQTGALPHPSNPA
jgi:hypothetical protein